MTIYATPFSGVTLESTGASADSGFTTFDEVINTLGKDYLSKTKRFLIYGTETERIAFTDGFQLHVDLHVNNG